MIILGAGLTGLSAAYHGRGVIYEMADEIGGHSKSKNVDGFVFDEGIHVLQTKNEAVLDLYRGLGLGFHEHQRSGWVFANGSFSRYPFQVNTAHLPPLMRAQCVLGYIKAASSSTPEALGRLRTYEEWLYATFGAAFAEKFFLPYSEKFWTVHPREMTHRWAGLRVPRPRTWDVIKGAFREQKTELGTHVHFRYPMGEGFGETARAFAPYVEVRLRKCLTEVDPGRKTLTFNGQETVSYERAISTIPLPVLVRLTKGVPDAVARAAERLRHNSILVVNLGIDRPEISEKHWVHFPQKDISFFRISFPTNFGPGLAPRGTSSVQAEVSYRSHSRVDPAETVDRVVEDLKRVGVLRASDRVVVRDTLDIHYAYVVYDHQREESVKTIRDYFKKEGIYPCGRYGNWAYFWSDEAILSGKKAAGAVRGELVEQEVGA